jgi:copper(I)-binding protein
MRTSANLLACMIALACMGTVSLAEVKRGGPWKIEGILIEQAWARLSPGGAKTGAVYLTIHNTSLTDDLLLAVDSAAAQSTAVHQSVVEDDIAKMKPMPFGVEIKSGKEVILKPGAIHIMLTGLSGALQPGDQLPVTMVFREAGSLELDVPVLPLGAKDPAVSHGGHTP